jgi:uncharacterized LabA/DUF88 family protein
MNPQLYVYVDGESHFIRSERCWQRINDKQVSLELIQPNQNTGHLYFTYPPNCPRIGIVRNVKFFWDAEFVLPILAQDHRPTVARAVYFTSMTGGDDLIHEAQVAIRSRGFEPQVIQELKTLADQRANLLNSEGVMDKAKGVDIGLAVRMLEDAYMNNYQECLLFTSDVDFLPAIQAGQRMGKRVFVFGYREGLSKTSKLEYEPDDFVDLEEYMKLHYSLKPQPPQSG